MISTKLTGNIRACFIHVALLITATTNAQEAQNNTDTAPGKKDQTLKLETFFAEIVLVLMRQAKRMYADTPF